jgi:hypothetical protein
MRNQFFRLTGTTKKYFWDFPARFIKVCHSNARRRILPKCIQSLGGSKICRQERHGRNVCFVKIGIDQFRTKNFGANSSVQEGLAPERSAAEISKYEVGILKVCPVHPCRPKPTGQSRRQIFLQIQVDGAAKMDESCIMSALTKHQPWLDVAVFEDANAAQVVKSFLTSKGLEARSYDDKLFRYFLFLRPPRVTLRVQVRKNQFKEANNFLDANAPDTLERAIHCPSCGSLRVSYPQMTRKFILPTIMLHLGIIFRVIDHECYCDHCHCIWTLPTEKVRAVPRPASHFPFSAGR